MPYAAAASGDETLLAAGGKQDKDGRVGTLEKRRMVSSLHHCWRRTPLGSQAMQCPSQPVFSCYLREKAFQLSALSFPSI